MRPQSNLAIFDKRSENSKSKTFNYSVSQAYHEIDVKPMIQDKFFQMPNDVRSQNNIGMYTNPSLMSLPCRSIDEANDKRNLGNIAFLNSSAKPVSWADKLGFVQERNGFTHDYKQKALVINTYRR